MEKNREKIKDINSYRELEETDLQSRLRSRFIEEGERSAREIEDEEKRNPVGDAPELLDKIIGKLQAEGKWNEEAYQREKQKEKYDFLTEEDQIALRRGRKLAELEKNWKRSRKRIMRQAAVFVLIGGMLLAGFSTEASRTYMMQVWGEVTGQGQNIFISKSDNLIVEGNEEEDRKKITDETGIDVPRLVYKPQNTFYKKAYVESETRSAVMEYEIQEEQLFVHMSKEFIDTQESLLVDGRILKNYEIKLSGIDVLVSVQKIKREDENEQYQAAFVYNGTYYFIAGKLKKKEFDKIIKKILF